MAVADIVLFDFQENSLPKIAKALSIYDSVLCVAPGGSGKTVIMSAITQRYLSKQTNKKVCIFVHREELLNQTREKLLRFGIISQAIDATTKSVDSSVNVYVLMVETFNRRAEKSDLFQLNFSTVGLYFCDEAHRSDFNKIFKFFSTKGIKRIGVTATPISAVKKHPLSEFYQVMIEIATQEDMIELNSLNPSMGVVPSDCYYLGDIDRSKLKIGSNGEFEEKGMSEEFGKQIGNTISAYREKAEGMKMLCFDVDVKHSKDMCAAFVKEGINARHVNGNDNKHYRRDCLRWLKETPGAVLNNVGILTTGFDEPSIECITVNKSVISLSLWIQMCVRGSRPFQYPNGVWKDSYKLLDMGNNASLKGGGLGNCNYNINWQDYFDNKVKNNKDGVPPCKTCPECKNLNAASARYCKALVHDWLSDCYVECGFIFPLTEKEEDLIPRELIKYIKDSIDVKKTVEFFVEKGGRKEGFVYYKIIEQIVNIAKQTFQPYLEKEQITYLIDTSIGKLKEWGKISKRRIMKEGVKDDLIKELQKVGFIVNLSEVEIELS